MAKSKKKWSEMNRYEKRRAVCQDVIDMLNAEKLVPCGLASYLEIPDGADSIGVKELRQMEGCHACARGALMAAKIMKSKRRVQVNGNVNSDDTLWALRDLFSADELATIETYYEGWSLVSGASSFYWRLRDPVDRMIAIMQNIIDNGEFRPEIEYVVYEV